jgi:zinc resistance-associated protein
VSIQFHGDETMKKTIVATALVLIVGLTGLYQAAAYMSMGGEGGCRGHHTGMAGTAQMDEATKAKYKAFLKDTQELRKKIAVKRAEKRALMRSENPDVEKVGEVTGELFDLRTSMSEKAEAAGLSDYIGMRGGWGKKSGSEFHHGQKGMMKGQEMMKN